MMFWYDHSLHPDRWSTEWRGFNTNTSLLPRVEAGAKDSVTSPTPRRAEACPVFFFFLLILHIFIYIDLVVCWPIEPLLQEGRINKIHVNCNVQTTFTQSNTHSHSASISNTLLFYEAQFEVQHLAQGHFGMQMGKTGDRTADLQVGGWPLYPSASI